MVHCAHEIWQQHGLRLEFTAPDSHERVAEREVRTIKEHVYSTILGLGHAIDDEMLHGIVRDTITLLNFFPNSETVDGTPRTYLDGERLDYSRWSRVYAGQVAEFEVPYPKQLNRGTRREIGYVIGHQGDNPIVRLLPAGKKLVIRSSHIKVLDKTPAIISLIEQGISGAKRQRFNDLLVEIKDFFDTSDGDLDQPRSVPRVIDWEPIAREPDAAQPEEYNSTSPTTIIDPIPEDRPPPGAHEEPNQPQLPPPPASELPSSPTLTPNTPGPTEETTPVRRSTRSGAQKPPGYYSKLASGESVSDYTACHMRAQECSSLYGADLTDDAGMTEVVNMIKVRKAALPVDYRKLSPRELREALPSFMFYKAKDLLPDEAEAATTPKTPTPSPDGPKWSPNESLRKRRGSKRGLKSEAGGSAVAIGNNEARSCPKG